MGKKIIAIVVSVAMILANAKFEVKAADTCSFPCYPYTVYGSSSISQRTAGASTSATPMSTVEVSADYSYVEGYESDQPVFHYWSKSNGGQYSTSVNFSVGYSYQSYSIHATHKIPGTAPTGHTEKYYP